MLPLCLRFLRLSSYLSSLFCFVSFFLVDYLSLNSISYKGSRKYDRKNEVDKFGSMFFVEFFSRGWGEVNIYYRGLSVSSLIPLSRLSREGATRKRERERMKNPWKKEEKRKGKVENRYGEIKSSIARLVISWKFEIGKSQPGR